MFRPVHQPVGYSDREFLPGNARAGIIVVQAGGNLRMFQCQHDLDQPGHARRAFGVPEIGLNRPDPAGALRVPPFADHRTNRFQFDRVTGKGARAVGFDVLHAARRNCRAGIRLAQHLFLTGRTGGSHVSAGLAVVVDCAAADHRVDRVTICEGIRQALEHQRPRAFAAHVTVGARVAKFAFAVGRHHLRLRIRNGDMRLQNHIHRPRHRHAAFAGAQALAGGVYRHQRGRTGSVQCQARALKTEEER